SYGQLMFWPHVGGQPFRFQCVATDLDGKQIAFDQPMIFMDNTMACPRIQPDPGGKLVADFNAAEINAGKARTAWEAGGAKREAELKLQRVALATSLKAGDTSVQVEKLRFSGVTEQGNA